ncbi:MAG: Bbp19 family protein [Candidatus Hodarchaeales archaeon]
MDLDKQTLGKSTEQIKQEEKNKKSTQEKSDKILRLKKAYQIFNSDNGKLVLEDLKAMCFYDETTMMESPTLAFAKEGRRQVIIQILKKIKETK